jgi:hypothetical protein
MRAQEQAWRDKLSMLKAQEEHEVEEALHRAVVEPVKADVAKMLGASGDKISDEGLEVLAKWKLNLP